MRRGLLRLEPLEGRDCPAVAGSFTPLSAGGDGVFALQVLGPGRHTVSIDPYFDRTNVTVDGGLQVFSPATADVSVFDIVGSQDPTATSVIQNNSAVNGIEVGGPGDDTLFGGRGAVNALFGLGGSNVLYSIVGGSQVVSTSPADRVFVNPNSTVSAPPGVPVVTFFAPQRAPGTPYFAQEADGVLYVTTSNNGSVLQLDDVGGGNVRASYDLGDGTGPHVQVLSNVKAVSYFGGAGADVYVNNTAVPEAAYGGAGNDFLLGGFGGVSILKGLAGADTVLARGPRVDASGNAGADTIVLFGAPNPDDVVRTDAADAVAGPRAAAATAISP